MPSKGPPRRPWVPDRPSSTGGSSDGVCRVLEGGTEAVYESVEALAAAVRGGEVEGDSRVKLPGATQWSRVSEVPALASELVPADPWAVWDAMDDGEPTDDPPTDPGVAEDSVPALPVDALIEAPVESEPVIAELPTEAVRVLPAGRKKDGRFVIEGPKQAKASRRPPGAGPTPSPPAKPVRGGATESKPPSSPAVQPGAAADISGGTGRPNNVIAFPSARGLDTLGPHALAPLNAEPLLELPALKVPPKTEPRTGPRWGILALVAFGAFGLVGAVNAWVRYVATQTFVPRAASTAVVAAEPVPPSEPAATAAVEPPPSRAELDELTALDQELRGRMRSDIGTVKQDGDLESALYVDLSRMNLSELKVDAVVTAWGGKRRDVPRSAEVQVGFRSRPGELDRELAAVGLIVGRYTQSYELDLARFEVLLNTGDAGVRRWPIDPAQARNYYIRRADLPTFLTNMRKTGGR